MPATPPSPAPHLSALLPISLVRGRRIGLFGGSFNPPHEGHRQLAEEALKRLRLHEVWWLPARRNPLKPADAYADHAARLAHTGRLAAHPRFRVLDLQWRLRSDYTIDLLRTLAPLLRQGRFVWLMGADSFATLHHWKDWRAITRLLPLAVFDRPAATLPALTSPAATFLRHHRLPANAAARLPDTPPPAWCFLPMRHNPQSSTRLRGQHHARP